MSRLSASVFAVVAAVVAAADDAGAGPAAEAVVGHSPDAGRQARPPGLLGFSDADAARAPGKPGEQALLDGRRGENAPGAERRATRARRRGGRSTRQSTGAWRRRAGGRRLQRLLDRQRLERRRRSPHVAHRRSTRWPRAGDRARRSTPGGLADGRPGRRAADSRAGHRRERRRPGESRALRALPGRVQLRSADGAERLQQPHPDRADAESRRHPQRDEPRRPHRAARRPRAAAGLDAAVGRCVPRPLGRRHARREDDELHGQDGELQSDGGDGRRHGRHAHPDRTFPARRQRERCITNSRSRTRPRSRGRSPRSCRCRNPISRCSNTRATRATSA